MSSEQITQETVPVEHDYTNTTDTLNTTVSSQQQIQPTSKSWKDTIRKSLETILT